METHVQALGEMMLDLSGLVNELLIRVAELEDEAPADRKAGDCRILPFVKR